MWLVIMLPFQCSEQDKNISEELAIDAVDKTAAMESTR